MHNVIKVIKHICVATFALKQFTDSLYSLY